MPVHGLADTLRWTGAPPLIGRLYQEEAEKHPELDFCPVNTTEEVEYDTLWDADEDLGPQWTEAGKPNYEGMQIGGMFRNVNGFASMIEKPDFELRRMQTYAAERILKMDEMLPKEFNLRTANANSIQSVVGRYEEACVRKELKRTVRSHAWRFWYGTMMDTAEDAAGYMGLYQTYRLAYTLAANFADPSNPADTGAPGKHFSVWLLRRSLVEDEGMHFVFNKMLAEIRLGEWIRTFIPDPANLTTKGRFDLVNNIVHRAGFANMSKYNAIRVYGFTDPTGTNPLTDKAGYAVQSQLPSHVNMDDYFAFMPKEALFYLRESRDNRDHPSVSRTIDGRPVEFPTDWAGWPIIQTDKLSTKED